MRTNHWQQQQHPKRIIVGVILWVVLKAAVSLLALSSPGERDERHLAGLFSYIVANDIATIIFIFHFTFLIANLERRLACLLASFRQWSRCDHVSNETSALDAYHALYDLLVVLIDLINLIFRLQVSARSLPRVLH
jgi:hypothetical protein